MTNSFKTGNIRRLEDGQWYWVDKAVIRQYSPTVGVYGIAVYNYLASLANARQVCFPSQKHIADVLGFSKASVVKAVRRLEESGLIRVDRTRRVHHVYHLLRVRGMCGAPQMLTTHTSVVRHVGTNNTYITRINKKKREGGFKPAVDRGLLAIEIARGLDDPKGLLAYLDCSRTYPQPVLRRAFEEVKGLPDEKIIDSRAALFLRLVKLYAAQARDPRD